MTQPTLELRCIDDLIDDAFVIPAYQRGYRWSSVEVEALLDDLEEFRQAKRTERKLPAATATDTRSALGNFYCLQPVVVLPRGTTIDGRRRWELIDGQQRLTTIFLIIRFLQGAQVRVRGSYTLSYDTRDSMYLDTLDPQHRWESPDSWYMHQAYETIQRWFADKGHYAPNDMAEVLLLPDDRSDFNTKVIWYELPEPATGSQAEIDAFIRLNAGKIRLTNAELIRALFLRAGNFPRDLRNLSQIKLAQEWDRIEKRLQDDRFWFFLHGGPSPYVTRIDHLFRVHLLASYPDLLAHIPETAEFRTFLGFQALEGQGHPDEAEEEQRSGISPRWDDIKQLAMRLEEWNEDRVLYHLVGFWIAYQGSLGNDNADVIVDLLARRETHKQKHSDFEEGLKADIFRALIDKSAPVSSDNPQDLLASVKARLDDLEYSHSNRKRNAQVIRPMLLLFNIATLLRNRTSTTRFPFELFRRQQWDLEHIRSVESRRPKKPEDQKRWLTTVVEYWTGTPAYVLLPSDPDEVALRSGTVKTWLAQTNPLEPGALHALLGLTTSGLDTSANTQPVGNGADSESKVARLVARAWLLLATERFDQAAKDDFIALYDDVMQHFGEKEPIAADNSMGNLTLLDARTNRGYRNAPFPMKRKAILALDKTGTFVPRCTTNVFLKYYSRRVDQMLVWSEGCAESHQQAMATTLAAFFAPGGHRAEEVRHG